MRTLLPADLCVAVNSGRDAPAVLEQAHFESILGGVGRSVSHCISQRGEAILSRVARPEPRPRTGLREAVFSSTGFRIRGEHGPGRALADWAEEVAGSLFFTFFPADCRICGSPLIEVSRLPVCRTCLEAVRPLQGSCCAVCGEALVSPLFEGRPESLCGLCQRAHSPFEKAVAYGSYEAGLRDLIHLLKYQQVRPAAKVLGPMLAKAIDGLDAAIPVGRIGVVAVPLHRNKKAQRGFNQSEMLAQAALKRLGRSDRFELSTNVLVRRRETESQIGRTRHQRRENLRGAFAVVGPVAGRDILLVDDVFTTGTTASECARVLLRAGAARVWVATVARTMKLASLQPAGGDREMKSRIRLR
jgi:ComF family protein